MIRALWHVLAVASALVTVVWLSLRPVSHDDNFLHLRTGEIVARTLHVPTADSFTHTVPGTAWTSHEWGYGVLLHAAHSLGGWSAVMWLMPLLVCALFAVVYFELRRFLAPARLAIAAPLLCIGVAAAAPSCLILRAALITSLGVALLNRFLRRYREDGSKRQLVGAACVLLIWANMHAGATFGVLVVGLHALQWIWDRRAWTHAAAITVGAALITLLNPSGIELWTFPARVNALFYASGLTYTMGQYRAPRPDIYPAFFALCAIVLLACLPLRARIASICSSRTGPMLAYALGTAFYGAMALRSNRFILDFVVFALPFCALCWSEAPLAGRLPAWLDACNVLVAIALGFALGPGWPKRPLDASVPVALASYIEREGLQGRMFNYENFGGYLGFKLGQPVYWDGRNDIFLPIAREFAHARDLGELIERHELDMLVLDPIYDAKFHGYLAAHRDQWGLVFWDDRAALYLRRVPKFERALSREFRLLHAFAMPVDSDIDALARNDQVRERVERELDVALSQSDRNSLAWYLRGRLAAARGDHAGAYRALGRSAALVPRPNVLFHLGQAALALGKTDEAVALADRAMRATAR